ncbi:unnamed protein product [Brachionus calyciflorus]|uniref:Phosphatidylinositol-specific phospholipase C X domain-containing protein n=1 Tax=Brachionus calyciflorus TaxID=104777 RepID=A0A813TN10_9BILA|nr:unnamed protein product [Brachionus calyciflorus]
MEVSGHKWMSLLSDNLKLLNITIPGTHNSCAYACFMFAKCQKNSLLDQLNHGVRYIDVRCKHINDTFRLHHGLFDLNFNYDTGCIDVCIDFLRQNPTETIVVLVSTEHKPKNNKLDFDDVFMKYLEKTKEHWYLKEECPTLGECRGKLVLLRRFYTAKRPLGIDMSGWRFNQTTEVKNHPDFGLIIQDLCSTMASQKWTEIEKVLDHAKSNQNNNSIWYINYCSAEKWPIQPPRFISWKINPKLLQYLQQKYLSNQTNNDNNNKNPRTTFGIIITDFADNDLVQSIYKVNF